MGTSAIQGVLEFWNKELQLSDDRLTTNQARKTFCTFGHRHTARSDCVKFQKTRTENKAVLFHFPWEALMAVTHHSCPKQFVGIKTSDRKYVCAGTWDDLEEESHISRRLNLWSQGHHVPPVETSTQDMLASISYTGSLKRNAY